MTMQLTRAVKRAAQVDREGIATGTRDFLSKRKLYPNG